MALNSNYIVILHRLIIWQSKPQVVFKEGTSVSPDIITANRQTVWSGVPSQPIWFPTRSLEGGRGSGWKPWRLDFDWLVSTLLLWTLVHF